jgi:ribosomal protein S6--L-glutamate ligase
MNLVSLDPLMTLGMHGVKSIKMENYFSELAAIKAADVVLFPGYWQVNSLVFGLGKRIFPSLPTYLLGHNKVEMTRAFWAVCPEHVPHTLILPNTPTAEERILDELFFPFVAKDIRSARGCGVYLINDREDFRKYASPDRDVLYVQMYLPISRDMRIVWIGDRVEAAYWRQAREGEFRNNVFQGGEVVFDPVPDAAIELVTQTARQLGINFAGFDVAEVDGHYYFFEFNNRFGNQAFHDAEVKLGELVERYLLRAFPDGLPPDAPVENPPASA